MKKYKTQKYIHVIPFSWTPITHDKSPQQLFEGENLDSDDNKSVRQILESTIDELESDKNRKFTFSNIYFF